MHECMIVFFIFAVVSIYYADAESCLYLGQHCNALATKKCCPPFTCKFVNQREGICVDFYLLRPWRLILSAVRVTNILSWQRFPF
uniref:Egg protein CP422 n=1 Tax=Schistosoma japonicum TaxID=6182 RepID=C7TY31_SCHJA|nr:Egg protein CP422 [Schistosoma japonicum]